jgi:hypothetical protein
MVSRLLAIRFQGGGRLGRARRLECWTFTQKIYKIFILKYLQEFSVVVLQTQHNFLYTYVHKLEGL